MPGAEEAFRINPPLYTTAPGEDNFGIEEERPGLTLIESKHGLRNILRKKANFSQECQVGNASSHLCTLQKDYTWIEMFDLPTVPRGLVFTKNSIYVEPFEQIIAERLNMFMEVYKEETALPPNCEQHFFPVHSTHVSVKIG